MVDAPSGSDQRGLGQGPHLDRDQCRDLLHGLLPGDEEHAAVSHAADCPACELLLQQMVAEREKLRAMQVLLASGDAPESPLARLWAGFSAAFRRPVYPAATAAVAAAAILLIVFWPQPQDGFGSAQLHWLPTGAQEVRLRNGAEMIADEELAAGLAAYAERDLERAIALLAGAEVSGPMETIRRIYLGNALARSGAYEKALAELRAVSPDPLPDPWRCETLWTLYIVLLETGHDAAADSLLRALAREPLEIGDRARALLTP